MIVERAAFNNQKGRAILVVLPKIVFGPGLRGNMISDCILFYFIVDHTL